MKSLALVITLSAFAAFSASITPNDQGIVGKDDSASIQNAVDAAVKNGSGQVVIPAWNARTKRSGWTVSRAILLPSDVTIVIDNAHLTMADGVYENFFRGANVWTDRGRTPEGKLSNIRILGRGNAVLDGGKANDLNESTSLKDGRPHVRANSPILLVNTERFEVSGLTVENHRYWGLCFSFCRFGRIADIRFIARYDRRNQDGINLRNGCHDITIERISGQTGDDMIALSAIDWANDSKWSYAVRDLTSDIFNVTIRDISGAAVCHPLVALRNHNGAKIHDILIENVHDADFLVPCAGSDMQRYALVRLGNGIYWSDRKSVLGETARITLRNLDCSHSALGVVVNGTLKDTLIDGIRCSGPCAAAVSTSGPDWGGIGATMENVTVANAVVASEAPGSSVFDAAFLNPGDFIRDTRLVNCSLVRAGRRTLFANECVDRVGGEAAAVVAHEGVAIQEGEVTADRSGRVAFEANFAEGLPGWKTRNYKNKLKLGVEELYGERAFSATLEGKDCDTLFELTGETFPVEARRGFRVDIRARGTMQMEKAAGQKGTGGTAVEFFDANGKMLESRFQFGFRTEPDGWTESVRHGIVPEGAVTARLTIGVDDPNFRQGQKLLVSRASVSLKTPGSACVQKGFFESAPFRPGPDPYFSTYVARPGKSAVIVEAATAADADGVPGSWSPFAELKRGTEVPLAANGWIKYRVTLLADGALAPSVRTIRFGDVWHTRWNLGPVTGPRVEVLTPSPTEDLTSPIRFVVGGPVAVDHGKTRVFRLTNFANSKETKDVSGQLTREGETYVLRPDGGAWKPGEIVKFKVVARNVMGIPCAETRLVRFAPKPVSSQVTLRGDGFVEVDGKPFFPIGIFSIKPQPQNGNSIDKAFDQLADAGFNLAHTYLWKREDPLMREYLESSERHGIRLLLNPARQENTIPVDCQRKNILAWYLADDTSRHWTPDELRMRSGLCRALDGGLNLTAQADSLGAGGRTRYFDYISCTDVFLPELYTVCAKEPIGNEVPFVGSQMKAIYRELKEKGAVKSIWALLQHFSGWGGWERYPTRQEQRAMSYLAIVRGAHGLMWYTYGDTHSEKTPGFGAIHSEESWNDLKAVTRELAALQDDLASPNAPTQPVLEILDGAKTDALGDPSVCALLKDNAGDKLLIVVNTATKPVRARLSATDVRKAEVLFENRAIETVESGTGTHLFGFEDDFGPLGVHVYRLKAW